MSAAGCTGSGPQQAVAPAPKSVASTTTAAATTAASTSAPAATDPGDGIGIGADDGTTVPAVPAADPHPLDGLTAPELASVRKILSDAGLATEATRYPYIGLHVPDKASVLAWKPGASFGRAADVVLLDVATKVATTATVDLQQRTVVTSSVQPNLIPGYVQDEFTAAIVAAQADTRMTSALQARGLDPAQLACLAFAPGPARTDIEVGKRLLRVSCFENAGADDYWSHPVDGLVATVDLDGGVVLSVTDTGAASTRSVEGVTAPPSRPALAPVEISTPQGPNVVIRGTTAEWAGWKFRWRLDRRVGMIVDDVSVDAGSGRVPVLYEGSLSDIFVPYQDPDPAWSWRTFLDAGEFGLGATLTELQAGIDCPASAQFVSGAVPNDRGDAYTVGHAVCLFERPTGTPAWRHSGGGIGTATAGAAEIELVLRSIATVGNYDYLIDVVFGLDGAIRFDVAAAGVVLQRATAAANEAEFEASGANAYGNLVAPNLVGVHHDHFLNFRLDLDVGGPNNRMSIRALVPTTVPGDPGRTGLWTTVDTPVTAEGGFSAPASPGSEIWRFESATPNSLGVRPAYILDPLTSLADPIELDGQPPEARAPWISRPLWLTAYSPDERFAGGVSLPGPGVQASGVTVWDADGGNVTDADLVVWFTMGFHHIVRSEDVPTMPIHRASFALVPENVFPMDPLLGFPAATTG